MNPIQIGGRAATAKYLTLRASSLVATSPAAISHVYARLQKAIVMRRRPYHWAPRIRWRERAYTARGTRTAGPPRSATNHGDNDRSPLGFADDATADGWSGDGWRARKIIGLSVCQSAVSLGSCRPVCSAPVLAQVEMAVVHSEVAVLDECGNNSVVECDLAKVEVAGSNPVSRSNLRSMFKCGGCPP